MTTDDPTTTSELRPIEELLADLDFWTGRTKIELVEEAVERWGAIVPHLLAHLELVLADPEGYCEADHDLLPYALVLLTHFREERAHALILALVRLPGEYLHDLLGDIKTTALPPFLLRTCGGSLDGVRSLVLNRSADEFVRWAAMETLCLAVVAGMADREDTIDFLAGLLTGEEDEPGSYFWAGVVNSLCDLYPDKVMDIVRKAFSDGLIKPGAIVMEDIEDTIAKGLEDALDHVRRELAWRVPDDIEQLLNLCEDIYSEDVPVSFEGQQKIKKTKAQRKKKKKMTKASRRKNR